MSSGTAIVAVKARQVYTERGHPGIQATVTTEGGAKGIAMCTAGVSVGQYEVPFAYDGGTRWRGKGVMRAVNAVNELIAPLLIGLDATKQAEVDAAMLSYQGLTPDEAKLKLGGNATAAVSAAALNAGAAALGIPLYQHIGGANAVVLPVGGCLYLAGGDRYDSGLPAVNKPSHEFVCYGFDTFAESSYAAWDLHTEFTDVVGKRYNIAKAAMRGSDGAPIGAGVLRADREIWDLATETICRLGYEGRVGMQIDCAAACYYHRDADYYQGLFEPGRKTRDQMIRRYSDMVAEYPFLILEDPLDEDDYEGHAILTRALGIQITGDDLFTTNPARVRKGIEAGAANTVLLKVNQIGTISEAFEMVRLAYRHGYGVQPCSSRGEGPEIADYCVGLMSGTVRNRALGATGNRFIEIEEELGSRAEFAGRSGIKGNKLTSQRAVTA
jgi:enolase